MNNMPWVPAQKDECRISRRADRRCIVSWGGQCLSPGFTFPHGLVLWSAVYSRVRG